MLRSILYIAKLLYRLRKRYLLQIIGTVPRFSGGFENVYTISPRGWAKIAYLQRKGERLVAATKANSPQFSVLDANYLLTGRGLPAELPTYSCARSIFIGHEDVQCLGKMSTLLLPLGFVPVEPMAGLFSKVIFDDTYWKTFLHVAQLSKLGLIPSDISLPWYTYTARDLGCSEEQTLIASLIRGGLETKAKLAKIQGLTEKLDKILFRHECAWKYHIELVAVEKKRLLRDNNDVLLSFSDFLGTLGNWRAVSDLSADTFPGVSDRALTRERFQIRSLSKVNSHLLQGIFDLRILVMKWIICNLESESLIDREKQLRILKHEVDQLCDAWEAR
jgi:hypothetical protein